MRDDSVDADDRATRGLQAPLSGVTATDPATYGGALILLSGTVLAAFLLPPRRALRFEPIAQFKA